MDKRTPIVEIKEGLASAHGQCIIAPRWTVEIAKRQLSEAIKKVKEFEDSDLRKDLLVQIRMALSYVNSNNPKEADKRIVLASGNNLLKI